MKTPFVNARTVLNLTAAGLALVAVWGCSTVGGRSAKHPISKGPYLQAPGPDTMSVMWESLTNHPGAVRYWREGQPEQRMESIMPRQMVGECRRPARRPITSTP